MIDIIALTHCCDRSPPPVTSCAVINPLSEHITYAKTNVDANVLTSKSTSWLQLTRERISLSTTDFTLVYHVTEKTVMEFSIHFKEKVLNSSKQPNPTCLLCIGDNKEFDLTAGFDILSFSS